mgnify:CR=1 FL=1
MDDIGSTTYLLILVLLMLSAFFSASETAFSAANMIRLRTMAEDGNKRAAQAVKVAAQYDKLIATILIGNNLVNIAISSLVTVIATAYFKNYAVAIATGTSTLVVLTFGEIIPKSFAKMNAESISMAFAGVLRILMVIFTPFSFLFLRLMQPFKKKDDGEEQPTITEQELMYMLDTIEEEGVLEEQEKELVQSALEFNDTTVEDILTPRVNMVAIDEESTPQEVLQIITEEGFSRIPVYSETVDHIIGVVHTRDILQAALLNKNFDIKKLMTEPMYVHRSMKIARLLSEFQRKKVHIAIVMDDYGGTLGIVTMEDIMEELVGEIWDEHDEVIEEFRKQSDGSYLVACSADLDDLYDLFDMKPSEEYDASSVSGWVMEEIGRVPDVGDRFRADGLEVCVTRVEHRRVMEIRVRRLPKGDAAPEKVHAHSGI